jgi:lauroyl/myristoyl acyltransferase
MHFMAVKDLYPLCVVGLLKVLRWRILTPTRNMTVRCVALAAYFISGDKKQLSEEHLRQAFGHRLSRREIKSIVRRSYYEYWCDIFCLLRSKKEMAALERAELKGVEHLQNALERKNGVILWESICFGRRFTGKQILHEKGFAVCQVHNEDHMEAMLGGIRPPTWVSQNVIKRFVEDCEQKFLRGIIYLPSSDSLVFTRNLLKRLKKNAIVCIAGDGKRGRKMVPVTFAGRNDCFASGMVSLAKISGAPILPMFCIYSDSDEKAKVIIEAPLSMELGCDRNRILQDSINRYIRLLENYIVLYPHHYRNWHVVARVAESATPDSAT